MPNNIKSLRSEISPTIGKTFFKSSAFDFLPIFYFLIISAILFFYRNQSNTSNLLLACFIIGVISEVLSMYFHEIGHRTKLGNISLNLLALYFISLFNLTSPHFWIFWHNAHHKTSDRWTAQSKKIQIGYEANGYPSLRKFLGPFELFIYKFFHLYKTKTNFLINIKSKKKYSQLKKLLIVDLIIIISFKTAIFFALPIKVWLFLEFLPLLLQSFLSSIFVVTQHSRALEDFLRPQIPVFSVRLSPFLDRFFLYSGLHFEHHLFPNLSYETLKHVNQKLRGLDLLSRNELSMQSALKKIYLSARTSE